MDTWLVILGVLLVAWWCNWRMAAYREGERFMEPIAEYCIGLVIAAFVIAGGVAIMAFVKMTPDHLFLMVPLTGGATTLAVMIWVRVCMARQQKHNFDRQTRIEGRAMDLKLIAALDELKKIEDKKLKTANLKDDLQLIVKQMLAQAGVAPSVYGLGRNNGRDGTIETNGLRERPRHDDGPEQECDDDGASDDPRSDYEAWKAKKAKKARKKREQQGAGLPDHGQQAANGIGVNWQALLCHKCDAIAEPIPGSGYLFKCAGCGHVFRGYQHSH